MDINEIKENLRFIEDETESVKRDIEETKRMSPIDQPKILPVGLIMLSAGILFAVAAFYSIPFQLGIFLFLVNGILAVGLIYFGAKITKLGYKFNRIIKRNERIVRKSERLKEELERLLAEKQ